MALTIDTTRRSQADAIALFLNRYLKPQGTIAKVAQREEQMQILLEAIDIPSHDHLVPWIAKAIETMSPEGVKTVRIYARRAGDQNCIWMEALALRSGRLMPMDTMTMAQTQLDTGDLLARSQSGDIAAIALYLDRALDNPSLRTHAELHRAVLKVTVETIQYLDGANFGMELAHKLKDLASPKVQIVEIYKRKSAAAAPTLLNRVELVPQSRRLDTPSN